MNAKDARPRGRVVHVSPGRVRARVSREDRSPEGLEQVRRSLAGHANVQGVEVKSRSGSILLRGESSDLLGDALRQVLDLVAEAGSPEAARDGGVEAAVGLVRSADDRLGKATQGRVRLRWLVPAIFIGFGVRELILEGLTLGEVPWYVLIYYGVDSFLKLYPQHAPQSIPAEAGEAGEAGGAS